MDQGGVLWNGNEEEPVRDQEPVGLGIAAGGELQRLGVLGPSLGHLGQQEALKW